MEAKDAHFLMFILCDYTLCVKMNEQMRRSLDLN